MESLETNKVFAAVLLAGIAFVGSGLIGQALVRPKELHEAVIRIEVAAEAPAGPASGPELPIGQLMAEADAGRGEAQVKSQGCVACHSFNQGGKAGVGPNLYGVIGAPHGHQDGFAYSAGLKAKAGPWNFAEMSDWLKKPSAYVPGTKMSYAGLADPKKRADIIEYLRTLAASPLPKPEASAAPPAAAPSAAAVVTGAQPSGPSATGPGAPVRH